jgi:hypothetical protein
MIPFGNSKRSNAILLTVAGIATPTFVDRVRAVPASAGAADGKNHKQERSGSSNLTIAEVSHLNCHWPKSAHHFTALFALSIARTTVCLILPMR